MNNERYYLKLGGKKYEIKYKAEQLISMDKYIRKEGITTKEICNIIRKSAGSITEAHISMKLASERLSRNNPEYTQAHYVRDMSEAVFEMERIPSDITAILIFFGLKGNKEAMDDGLSEALVAEWMSEDEFLNENFIYNTNMLTNAYIVTHPTLANLARVLGGEAIEEIEDDIQRRVEGVVNREERAAKKLRQNQASPRKKTKRSTSASRKKAT